MNIEITSIIESSLMRSRFALSVLEEIGKHFEEEKFEANGVEQHSELSKDVMHLSFYAEHIHNLIVVTQELLSNACNGLENVLKENSLNN